MKFKNWFYGICIATTGMLLLIAAVTTISAFAESAEGDYSAYPTLTYAEFTKRFEELERAPKKKATVEELYSTVHEIYTLEKSVRKANQQAPLDPRYRQWQVNMPFTRLTESYTGANLDLIEKARVKEPDKYRKLSMDTVNFALDNGGKELDMSGAWLWWFWFHFGPIPFIAVHFWLKHRELGNNPWLAFTSDGKYPFAVFFWEIGIFKYPVAVSYIEQLRQAYQLVTYALSGLLWFSCGAFKLFAQDQAPRERKKESPRTWTLSGSSLYVDKYLGLDGAVFYPAPVIQSNVTISHSSGIYADFWKSVPLGDTANKFGSEEDYTLGYVAGIGSKTKLNLSTTYFNVFPLLDLPRGDLIQVSGRAERSVRLSDAHSITPYLWARGVFPLRNGNPPGGYFFHPGASHALDITKQITVSSFFETVRDSGAFGFNQGWVARFSFSLSIKLGKRYSLIVPAFAASKPLTDTRDGRKLERALGFGLAYAH